MKSVLRLVCLVGVLVSAAPLSAQERQLVVRQLDFKGNHAIQDEVLASAIATTNSSWFARNFLFRWIGLGAKRYFDEQEFRRDVVRLGVLYKRSGYNDAAIDTLVRRTPEDVYITFNIQEGAPVVVATLIVTGLDSLPDRTRPARTASLGGFGTGAIPRLPSSPASRSKRRCEEPRSHSTSRPGEER